MIRRQAIRFMLALAFLLLYSTGCETAQEGTRHYLFFPPPPATPRIQYLIWANGSHNVLPERSAFEKAILGDDIDASQRIEKPYGLAAYDGSIYVCDTKGLNLTRLDFKNKAFSILGQSGPGRLRKPINVTIDPLGYKFVADPYRKQIVVFGPDDSYVTALEVPQPCHPVDVAVFGEEIYVLDNDATCQIVVMNRTTGEVIRTFGSKGQAPGQFNIPSSFCLDAAGNIYVSDTLNFRIQKLDPEGNPIWVKGNPGYRLGQFGRPRGIRTGPDGVIYVVEGAMELVQMIDSEGNILMSFGGPGTQPGSMLLPSAIAIDKTSIPYFQEYIHPSFQVEYLLLVANQYGNQLINVFAYGSFPEDFNLSGTSIQRLPSVNIEKSIGSVEDADPESPVKEAVDEGADPAAPATESDPPEKERIGGRE